MIIDIRSLVLEEGFFGSLFSKKIKEEPKKELSFKQQQELAKIRREISRTKNRIKQKDAEYAVWDSVAQARREEAKNKKKLQQVKPNPIISKKIYPQDKNNNYTKSMENSYISPTLNIKG